jgi:hypothetical protein
MTDEERFERMGCLIYVDDDNYIIEVEYYGNENY